MTIEDLKNLYEEKVDRLVTEMRFVSGGAECKDHLTLMDCNIGENTAIVCVWDVTGGVQ